MPGANALMPSSAYMYQTSRSGSSRAVVPALAQEPVHVLDGDLVARHEQVALGGEVLVEQLGSDAELRDEVGHARAGVAVAREAAGGGVEDRVARLLVAARDEVDLGLARGLDAAGEAGPDGRRPQPLHTQRLDLAQQREVLIGVERPARAGLLRRRQQPDAHVVVDGAPRHSALALEFGYRQRPHVTPRWVVHPSSAAMMTHRTASVSARARARPPARHPAR